MIKRILLKIALRGFVKIEKGVNNLAIGNWLYNSYKDKGFAHYNTVRKKMINELLSTGLEQKEYWISIGRLKELQSLGLNIKEEFNRRSRKEKKEVKK